MQNMRWGIYLPKSSIDFYDYLQPFTAIFHLSVFGLALTLAYLSPDAKGDKLIAVTSWLRRRLYALRSRPEAS
jgi:hypothetical protein